MADNAERLAALETTVNDLVHIVKGNGQPGIATQVTQMAGSLKFLAWFIPIAITALGVWIASLEWRHKVADAPPAYSRTTDATLPPTYEP